MNAREGGTSRDVGPTRQPLSVSQFLQQINAVLETQVAWVEGEVSNFRTSQGKFVYFDLKDEESVLSCFMMLFRLRVPLEDGMKVRLWGAPGVYAKYGKFSLTVEQVELSGEGALRRAYELLKIKLEAEGLFAPERKRALPRFPERIGLVTSPDAAAYSDFLKVLRARRGGMEIVFAPAAVQGREAPDELIHGIEALNEQMPPLDALVIVRGGGSLEDLHAFNDERVVRVIARSRIPTIVGVGHERDVSLADLVADLRGSTPSNAAELLTPTRQELMTDLTDLVRRMDTAVHGHIQEQEHRIRQAVSVLRESVYGTARQVIGLAQRMSAVGRIILGETARRRQIVDRARELLTNRVQQSIGERTERIGGLERLLGSLHPDRVLARGYSVTQDDRGHVVRSADEVEAGARLRTRLARGTLESIVQHLWPHATPRTSPKRTKNSRRSSPPSSQATLI